MTAAMAFAFPVLAVFFSLLAMSLPYFGKLSSGRQVVCVILAWLLVPALWIMINLLGLNGLSFGGDEDA